MASIQGIYIALFGRPADPAGLAFFNAATSNGANLAAIGDLSATAEYQARFAGKSNTQIITDIYMSLFGRAPDAAGLAFFVDVLNKGTQTINTIAINIFDGAQGTDKTLLEKKVAAADLFTAELDTPVEIGNYTGLTAAAKGVAFITAVTATSTPVDKAAAAAAVADIPNTGGSAGVTGVSINLTAGIEVGPNAANPANKTTAGDDTIAATNATLGTQKIDAGAGADVMNYSATGGAGGNATGAAPGGDGAAGTAANLTVKPVLTGVESLFVKAIGGAGGADEAVASNGNGGNGGSAATSIDVDGSTGLTALWNDSSTKGANGTDNALGTGTPGTGGAATVAFTNTNAATQTYGLKGTITDTTSWTQKTDGAADTATLALKGANTAANAVSPVGIENLKIAVDGSSTVNNLANTTLQTATVTGTGNLTVTSDSTTLKTFDAGALKGAVTADISSSVAGTTVTGTSSADKVTLNAGSAADKDVVVYSTANVSTKSQTDTLVNFTLSEDKIDLKAFALTAPAAVTVFTSSPANDAAMNSVAVYYDAVAGDSYVYADINKDGKFNEATDLVIKLDNAGAFDATGIAVSDFIFA